MWCKRRKKGQKDLSRAVDPHSAKMTTAAPPQDHSGKRTIDICIGSSNNRSDIIDRSISNSSTSAVNKGQGVVIGHSETSASKTHDSKLDEVSAALEKTFSVKNSAESGSSEIPDDDLQTRISEIVCSLTGSQNLPSISELVRLASGSSCNLSASANSNLAVLLELLKTQLLLTTMNPIPAESSSTRTKSHPATKDKPRKS